jgi:hypothetical protein
MVEITEQQKRNIIKELVKNKSILMLKDVNTNQYKPIWNNDWTITLALAESGQKDLLLKKYQAYIAVEEEIDTILAYGDLEWEFRDKQWFVEIFC